MAVISKHCESLLSDGIPVGAEIAERNGLRKWIVIAPFKINPITGMPTLEHGGSQPWSYRIRCVGLPVTIDQKDVDVEEEYLTDFENLVVQSLPEAELVVSRWLDDFDLLDDLRGNHCPI